MTRETNCSACGETATPVAYSWPSIAIGQGGGEPVGSRVTVCGSCGHIDFFATDPARLTRYSTGGERLRP